MDSYADKADFEYADWKDNGGKKPTHSREAAEHYDEPTNELLIPSPFAQEFETSTGEVFEVICYDEEYFIRDKADEECIIIPMSDLDKLTKLLSSLEDAAT